ncbi:MAG: hypothetical protein FJ161_00585 [Gammaproteobacteria bacterium]|nr:hypothetical protein [Gammaproteobacteria bacterium]
MQKRSPIILSGFIFAILLPISLAWIAIFMLHSERWTPIFYAHGQLATPGHRMHMHGYADQWTIWIINDSLTDSSSQELNASWSTEIEKIPGFFEQHLIKTEHIALNECPIDIQNYFSKTDTNPTHPALAISDPDGYLALTFIDESDPHHVLADLKTLLKFKSARKPPTPDSTDCAKA